MLTPPARWCLLEGTILIGWYRNGSRKNHPPTCKQRAGGFALCDRKSYECLSASFPAFYLVVSGKKRNFAAKLDVDLFPFLYLQQRLQLGGIEAGTCLLHARQVTMTQYHLDVWETVVEVDNQPEHRILLGIRSGVGYAAPGIQSALITDADGVGVGSTGMRTHPLYRTALMNLAIARNIIMIADIKPAVHFHMVVAQLLYCVRVIAAANME